MTSRSAGLLLHPTSLPSRLGIGDLGPGAEAFLDWAEAGGQHVWQILPVGPTGHFNSPYSALSAFAGNPLLISPERLVEEGYAPPRLLEDAPRFPQAKVAYRRIIPWKMSLLRRTWDYWQKHATRKARGDFASFSADPAQAPWLDEWVLYSALKERHHGRPWFDWASELARREPAALAAARRELTRETSFHAFVQFLFFRQWDTIKAAAGRKGISIFGDLPIYVAQDSADVWAHPDFFVLDERGHPLEVSGVPPDYFSETGQLWGNPLYRWDRLEDSGFAWWIERMRASFRLADVVRLDHFRGFVHYWAVPASEPTAANGSWLPGPGKKLFDALRGALGELRLVAEDLGMITDDVRELRNDLGLPGIRVLQFAFGDAESEHLPANHDRNTVVFTGTHDNDTAAGWFASLDEDERQRVRKILDRDAETIEWAMIRSVQESEADLAIVPVQDVLGLGSEARMNLPSEPEGNWEWRLGRRQLRPDLAERLRRVTEEAGRLAPQRG